MTYLTDLKEQEEREDKPAPPPPHSVIIDIGGGPPVPDMVDRVDDARNWRGGFKFSCRSNKQAMARANAIRKFCEDCGWLED